MVIQRGFWLDLLGTGWLCSIFERMFSDMMGFVLQAAIVFNSETMSRSAGHNDQKNFSYMTGSTIIKFVCFQNLFLTSLLMRSASMIAKPSFVNGNQDLVPVHSRRTADRVSSSAMLLPIIHAQRGDGRDKRSNTGNTDYLEVYARVLLTNHEKKCQPKPRPEVYPNDSGTGRLRDQWVVEINSDGDGCHC
jgi:hypothetical protein